jgi:hypothetical protein
VNVGGSSPSLPTSSSWYDVETNKGNQIMKSMIKCSECGRRRKAHHERLVGTDKAHSPKCLTLEQWRKNNPKKKALAESI